MKNLGRYIYILCVTLILSVISVKASATAFFETGEAQVTTTLDNGGWVTVNLQKSYVNPVVIAGPVSHNNVNSLSARIRNVSGNSFEIGVQSPCESFNRYAGTTPPAANTCPVVPWVSESVQWIVIEQGTWVFPDGTKVEAYNHPTNTLRSKAGSGSARDVISFSHNYTTRPAIIHSVSSFNEADWVTSSVWGPSTNRNTLPDITGFSLTLEGGEAENSHATEVIGWMAIEPVSGLNNGNRYSAGVVDRIVDRHNDECQIINIGASYTSIPNVIAKHNTMAGGDGSWVRLCGTEIGLTNFFVHMDEDQVTDVDRTGIDEAVSWFAFENVSFGVLEFLTATKTVTDEDSDGIAGPGELLTYTVTITNQQDDFAQVNNPTSTEPEFIDVLDANVSFDSVVSASSGSLTYNSTAGRLEWQGSVPASGTVTLQYRARVNSDMSICALSSISNQGQLNMDPIDDASVIGDIDNLNQITELTDDPGRDDGVDSDSDGATDDDDATVISAGCLADISVTKDDSSVSYTPGQSSSYTIVVSNSGPHTVNGMQVSDSLPSGLTISGVISCSVTTGTGNCGAQSISGQNYNQTINLDKDSAITVIIPVIYDTDPSSF
ncbi:hypothetical protein DL796_09515 [Kangiella spongicola]|uniref:Uncharacterized protein n=1 Tax=Kangiella spongicola TaxID=796379 RepID=A0A318D418_9GAMM|nr:hypothetical protein DL796_09515 [Kangiella spongicola]